MTFRPDNTDGFSEAQLRLLNNALALRLQRGEDEKSASDAITNAWIDGAALSDLIQPWDPRPLIRDAYHENDFAVVDGVMRLFNCREVGVDEAGDVWIADPQTGHWLDDGNLAQIGLALLAGDI